MVRLPLKIEIFLVTKGDDYICTVIFAGKDTIQAINVKKRIYELDGNFHDIFVSEQIIIDRDAVVGYSNLKHIKQTITEPDLIGPGSYKTRKGSGKILNLKRVT